MLRIIKFARGDFLKKYAPESLYNTDPNAREIRDAVLQPRKRRPEAMIRADIKTNLSGKHTEHRKSISEMEGIHASRQGYLKTQGLHTQAEKEDVAHRAAVATKEADYAESYLGKRPVAPKTSPSGMVKGKELERLQRSVRRAPRKRIPKAELQSAGAQADTFARSAAGELRANASIMRSARIATGATPSRTANERLVTVLPGLRKMVSDETRKVMAGDKEKAGRLRERVEGMARKKISTKVGNPEVLETRVKQVTAPMFQPGAIGKEKDLFDAPSIAKKIGVSPRTVEGIHRSHSKLIGSKEPFVSGAHDWKAERTANVTRRVLQKGEVFSPLRSAMHAKQNYPFIARNARRITTGAALGGAAIAGAGALLVRKLRRKTETQFSIQFARGDRFQKLLNEAAGMGVGASGGGRTKIITDRLNSAQKGLRQTLAEKALAGEITPEAHVAMRRILGKTRSTLARNVNALRRTGEREGLVEGYRGKISELTKANETLSGSLHSQAARHGAEKRRILKSTDEVIGAAKTAHDTETDLLRRDVRNVRRIGRERTKKALIIGTGVGVSAGSAAGYGAGRTKNKKEPIEFDIKRIGTATHDRVFTDGTRVDINKLIGLVKGRKSRKVEIASLKGISKAKKSGYSEDRLKGARTSKPILINSTREVVDGRHRCIKTTMKGGTHIQAIRVTKKDLAQCRLAAKVRPIWLKAQEKHPTTGHDVAIGAIEGGLGVLATDRLIHKFAPSGSSVGRKILIGAGVGGAATGAVGALLSKLKRRRQQPTNFATLTIPMRTAVTKDRYIKHIHEADQDTAEHNYVRSAAVGGAIGALLRKSKPLKKAATIGAGTGLAIQAVARAGTSKTKDQFGDRTYVAKRIDRAPAQVGALVAGGLLVKRIHDQVKKAKAITRFEIVEFDDQKKDPLERTLRRIARNPEARGEEIYRNVNRVRRLVRDVREPGRLDSRGRPSTPEWQKPWVKKAIGIGALAIGVRKGVGAVRSLRATAAAQKAVTGEARGVAGIFDAGESFFRKSAPGTRSGMEKFIRSHREVSRPILRVRNEFKGIKRDTSDLINNKAEGVFRRWTGKRTPEAEKAVVSQRKNAQVSEVKERLKAVRDTPNPPSEPGKKRKIIPGLTQFAESIPDWDVRDARGRSVRVFAPGSQRRIRRKKTSFERIDTERKVRDAVTVGTLVSGAVGTHLVHRRIESRRIAAEQPNFTEVPGQPGFRETTNKTVIPPSATKAVNAARRRTSQIAATKTAQSVKNVLKKI